MTEQPNTEEPTLVKAARDVVNATIQHADGTWIIGGDGEVLIGALQDAVLDYEAGLAGRPPRSEPGHTDLTEWRADTPGLSLTGGTTITIEFGEIDAARACFDEIENAICENRPLSEPGDLVLVREVTLAEIIAALKPFDLIVKELLDDGLDYSIVDEAGHTYAGHEQFRGLADLHTRLCAPSNPPSGQGEEVRDICPGDGNPCYAGAGTDDARFRCGTVQCGQRALHGFDPEVTPSVDPEVRALVAEANEIASEVFDVTEMPGYESDYDLVVLRDLIVRLADKLDALSPGTPTEGGV